MKLSQSSPRPAEIYYNEIKEVCHYFKETASNAIYCCSKEPCIKLPIGNKSDDKFDDIGLETVIHLFKPLLTLILLETSHINNLERQYTNKPLLVHLQKKKLLQQ